MVRGSDCEAPRGAGVACRAPREWRLAMGVGLALEQEATSFVPLGLSRGTRSICSADDPGPGKG